MNGLTHEYFDILYELEGAYAQWKLGKDGCCEVSYIRDQLLSIVDQLYCRDWDDFDEDNEEYDDDSYDDDLSEPYDDGENDEGDDEDED